MSKEVTISNLWSHIKFFCGCKHGDDICGAPLDMQIQKNQVYLICPKCGESIPYFDVEKFMNKFSAIVVDDTEAGIESNMTNFKHKLMSRIDKRVHEFTVLVHTNKELKVSIKNE